MPEMLESTVIRHLIFRAKLSGDGRNDFQISTIVQSVIDMAVRDRSLREPPNLQYQNPLADKITAVIWELIIEGIYTPGGSMQHPNLPFLRLTEHGNRCFEVGELTAHDPDDYLGRLKMGAPEIDETTLLYTGEALDSFRSGNYLASAVMVGVAAEKMLLRLSDAVHTALNSPQRQLKFEKDTSGKNAKAQHDAVLARLRSPITPLPTEIDSVLTQHVDGIYDLIRRTRNDAGHPTGRRMERFETHALLLLFPTYCKTVHDLMEWLAKNQI